MKPQKLMQELKAKGKARIILKKLRQKFVALIMAILAVLLTCVAAIACYLDWSDSYSRAQRALELSIEDAVSASDIRLHVSDDGSFGDAAFDGTMPQAEGAPAIEGVPDAAPDRGGKDRRDEGRPMVDISTATYSIDDGRLRVLPGSRGLLAKETAEEAASQVASAPDGMHELTAEGLIYLKQERMGTQYVAFADSAVLDGWKALALTLGAVEIAVLAVFLAISIAFSKWALRPVQQAWSKQREFVSNASHELKTPLSVVSANTSILLEEPDMPAAEREQWLRRSETALDGMKSLINEMLDLASFDETEDRGASNNRGAAFYTDNECVAMDRADLSRIALAACLQFESLAYERGFSLEEDIEEGAFAAARETDAKRVVETLLDNACKYVDAGGTVRVRVARTPQGAAEFSVSNTGAYIQPEKIEHIFDRFYRVDDARTRGEGHGLGLSIACSIVDEAGGSISVESSPDITVFTVVFQVAEQ